MRLFRRAKPSSDTSPQVEPESAASTDAVEPAAPDELAVTPTESYSDSAADVATPPAEPQARQRRPWLPFLINWPAMFLIVALVALTVAALLFNEGALPDEIVAWWPLAIMVPAAVWFLVALLSRDSRGLLGSATLFGLSTSLLLASQKIDLLPTIVGITFIAIGAGIMLRGLLLRNQPIT